MKSESHTYIFFGRVLPERANVNISSLNFEWKNIEGEVIGELNTSILVSQINAQITLKQRPDELITLKNGIEEAMRVQLDLLGYTNSCGYDLEIIQVTDLLGNIEVFGANIDDTNQFPLKRPKKFNEIIPLFSTEKGDYLRLSLSDLREAIRNPKDSGFFCYRSIECLRQYFVDHKVTNNIEKDKKSWIIFRDELNIDYPKIRIQMVLLPELAKIYPSYVAYWEKIADEVGFLDERSEGSLTEDQKLQANWACSFLWQRGVILWDGTVLPCLMHGVKDFSQMKLGNVRDMSVRDMWLGEKNVKNRLLHKEGRSHEIDACVKCSYRTSEIKKLMNTHTI